MLFVEPVPTQHSTPQPRSDHAARSRDSWKASSGPVFPAMIEWSSRKPSNKPGLDPLNRRPAAAMSTRTLKSHPLQVPDFSIFFSTYKLSLAWTQRLTEPVLKRVLTEPRSVNPGTSCFLLYLLTPQKKVQVGSRGQPPQTGWTSLSPIRAALDS